MAHHSHKLPPTERKGILWGKPKERRFPSSPYTYITFFIEEKGIQARLLKAHGISQRPAVAHRGPGEGAESMGWVSSQRDRQPAWAALLQENRTGFCTKQRQSKSLAGQIPLHFLPCPQHQKQPKAQGSSDPKVEVVCPPPGSLLEKLGSGSSTGN